MENFDPKEELELGLICFKRDDQIGARKHWENAPNREDDTNSYGKAQFDLGIFYGEKNDIEHTLEHWNNLLNVQCFFQKGEYNDSLKIYSAQKIVDYFKKKIVIKIVHLIYINLFNRFKSIPITY